ncbi:MAG: LysM peptidoglycan-binding domain-containing M23 family metallopeptidase [Candidatus Omnitrophota bacterium]|jgi:murein DD-endopeptidase MepM/ murein hydrolase activator NlpD
MLNKSKKYLIILTFIFCAFTLFGCATTPLISPEALPQGSSGIYHRVERGQTLWGISKVYGVDLDNLARLNRISDATALEVGQLIFIPGQKRQEPLPVFSSGDDFIWPIKGRVIASFGSVYNNMVNKGINIRPVTNSDVSASRSGKVVFSSGNFGGFGKTLIIDHGDGLSTVYARNSQIFVKAGDVVQKGQLIAKAGSAGRDKNVYLHFEVRKGYISENPYYYLP